MKANVTHVEGCVIDGYRRRRPTQDELGLQLFLRLVTQTGSILNRLVLCALFPEYVVNCAFHPQLKSVFPFCVAIDKSTVCRSDEMQALSTHRKATRQNSQWYIKNHCT